MKLDSLWEFGEKIHEFKHETLLLWNSDIYHGQDDLGESVKSFLETSAGGTRVIVSSSGCGSFWLLIAVEIRTRHQMSLLQFRYLSPCPAFLRKWIYSFVIDHLKMQTKPFY